MPSEKSQRGSFSVFKSGVKNSNNNATSPLQNFSGIICFGEDSKDFKEIVYNSKIRSTLTLSVEVLTNDSPSTRLATRNKRPGVKKRIPRPQNAFMIYRRDKFASPEFAGVKSSVASVKIGKMWKEVTPEEYQYYSALAMLALENHSKKYENYQYQPRASKRFNRQKTNQLENIENISPEIITSPEMNTLPEMIDFTMFEEMFQPQVSVTPPSPPSTPPTTDGYLSTPVTLSPIYGYLSQHSPIINGYLPTPPSSVEYSPVVSPVVSDELNLEQSVGYSFPHLNDITKTPSENPDDSLFSKIFEFLSTTATNVPELQPESQPESQPEPQPEPQPEVQTDFDFNFNFNPFELPMDMLLESTMDIIPATNNLDPSEWQINDDSALYPDQMDHVYAYDIGHPSEK